MGERVFRGQNLREALKQVKRELGEDAIIISTREVKSSGSIFARKVTEVVAALTAPPQSENNKAEWFSFAHDETATEFQNSSQTHTEKGSELDGRLAPLEREVRFLRTQLLDLAREKADIEETQKLQSERFLEEIEKIREEQKSNSTLKTQTSEEQDTSALASDHQTATATATDTPSPDSATKTLESNQREAAASSSSAQSGVAQPKMNTLIARFKLMGVEETLASELALAMTHLNMPLRQGCERVLEHRIAASGPVGFSGAKVIMFVGPAGSGKTTTIAKLAAQSALQQGKSVSLVTLDSQRIGAVEQIQGYAQLIGIPMHVAASAQDFTRIMNALSRYDLVFVDTAGRTQKEAEQLAEISDAVDSLAYRTELHLALPANMALGNMRSAIQFFGRFGIDRICVTKSDEIVDYAPLLNTLASGGLPISYWTHGPKIPEDIEVATSQRMARFFADFLCGPRRENVNNTASVSSQKTSSDFMIAP